MKFNKLAAALLFGSVCSIANAQQTPSVYPAVTALLVGGGPQPNYNQVAIESNLRYLNHLLPLNDVRQVLFANGSTAKPIVLYDTGVKGIGKGEQYLNLIWSGSLSGKNARRFRKPSVGSVLNGPSTHKSIANALGMLGEQYRTGKQTGTLLLYFTGHGSPDNSRQNNNYYDLWKQHGGLSVQQLSADIQAVPRRVPLVVVMVQCFSGAFGNLIFKHGDAGAELASRNLAGFFATVNTMEAAGCTPEINQADYHDFTSYFFAALGGRDRLGRKVTGADYDNNGVVSMHEAYCYALIHDPSIDVPCCTSDFFLRRYVTGLRDSDIFQTDEKKVYAYADPAQKAALKGLAARLGLHGERSAYSLYQQFIQQKKVDTDSPLVDEKYSLFEAARKVAKQHLLQKYPSLNSNTTAYDAAVQQATAWLQTSTGKKLLSPCLQKYKDLQSAISQEEKQRELVSAKLRYLRLFKTIVLTMHLMQGDAQSMQERFKALQKAEDVPLLPQAPAWNTDNLTKL